MSITPEEKRILAKMKAKKTVAAKELIGIVNPVLNSMCINPRYATAGAPASHRETHTYVHPDSTKNLKRAGINTKYGGWAATFDDDPRKRPKNFPKKVIYINNEMSREAQIVTLAHETGHVVMKRAIEKDVGVREAERKAHAMERVFADKFNKRYKTLGVELDFGKSKSKFKPRKGDAALVMNNINNSYLKKGCKL